MPKLFLYILLFCFSQITLASQTNLKQAIGIKEIVLDKDSARPIELSLWYPTGSIAEKMLVGENRVFQGVKAIKDAQPDNQRRALVVLSHGYKGNWRNFSWLAKALAEQGYIVAAPNHPGTTSFEKTKENTSKLWERPHDLSRIIDFLIKHPSYAGKVDSSRISAIGHSLGGWTVAALAGIEFDKNLFLTDCEANKSLFVCAHKNELGLEQTKPNQSVPDSKLASFILLDAGMLRGFSPESIQENNIPALIIGAGIDIGDMPVKLESGYFADNLKKEISSYVEIPDAMHFSFLPICKSDAIKILEEKSPNDRILCIDANSRSRSEIHNQVVDLIIQFLEQSARKK